MKCLTEQDYSKKKKIKTSPYLTWCKERSFYSFAPSKNDKIGFTDDCHILWTNLIFNKATNKLHKMVNFFLNDYENTVECKSPQHFSQRKYNRK